MRLSQSDHFLATKGFTVQDNIVQACNGVGLKNVLQAGSRWLEAHREMVNGLNVFPIPDGDTGNNMTLTMQSALAYVEKAPDHKVETIAATAAYGALMGARGNSGVILSQFLQGLAQGLEGKVTFTAEEFALAAECGTRQAYQSVIEPVEGTILTIVRAASEAARQKAEGSQDLVELVSHIVEAVKTTQANTPELLPILKEAGVTDAGGQGLLLILEGGLRFLQNKSLDLPSSSDTPVARRWSTLEIDKKNYGFDVQFLITGEKLDVEKIRANIDRMGWSTLVVGDSCTVKVHVHVENPDQPLNYGAGLGTISDIIVEDMGEQVKMFAQDVRKITANIALVSIVTGRGLTNIFRSLGADWIIPGGQAANPSTQEVLEAIGQIETDEILILPNNRNIILTVQQAGKLSEKLIGVVPTETIPQGIAALLSFNDQLDLKTNTRRMLDAAQQVRAFEIIQAVRDATMNGFKVKRGDLMGLFDNRLISVGQRDDEVVLAGLAQIEVNDYELMTIYSGQASSPVQANTLGGKINALYPNIEVEVHEGGQPDSHYIISLE